jgi:xanthine dehydrogenase molybdopterin-binding subunit B/xanthine dehydrogenase iron-sulfur cluster and FAD-binding subunit A
MGCGTSAQAIKDGPAKSGAPLTDIDEEVPSGPLRGQLFKQVPFPTAPTTPQPYTLQFYLNDEYVAAVNPDPLQPLAWTLREVFSKTGTKVVCGQGQCGACTVGVLTATDTRVHGVNSCLFPTGSLLVAPNTALSSLPRVYTVEYVSTSTPTNPNLQPFATTLANCSGTQCGFCTAGMVMKAFVFGPQDQAATYEVADVEDLLDGNLCRCTGYRSILYSLKTLFCSSNPDWVEPVETPPMVLPGSDNSYPARYANGQLAHKNVFFPNPEEDASPDSSTASPAGGAVPALRETQQGAKPAVMPSACKTSADTVAPRAFVDPTTGVVPHGQRKKKKAERALLAASPDTATPAKKKSADAPAGFMGAHLAMTIADGPTGQWLMPTSFQDALTTLGTYPNARIVAGNANSSFIRLDSLPAGQNYMSLRYCSDMNYYSQNGQTLEVGAMMPINDFRSTLISLFGNQYEAITQHLFTVANMQVRDYGTLIGNMTGVRYRNALLHSDISLICKSLTGQLELWAGGGDTAYLMDVADYVNGVTLPPPLTEGNFLVRCVYLNFPTNGNQIQIVRSGTRFENCPGTSCSYVDYGNSTYAFLLTSEDFLNTSDPTQLPTGLILWCMPPAAFPSGGITNAYGMLQPLQNALTAWNFDADNLRKAIQLAARAIGADNQQSPGTMMTSLLTERKQATQQYNSQTFYVNPESSPVTEPFTKPASYLHVDGQATFTMDVPGPVGTLSATPVLTTRAVVTFDAAALKTKAQATVTAEGSGGVVLTYQDVIDFCGGDTTKATALNCMIDDSTVGSRGYAAGAMGEFVLGQGFTTYAGQAVCVVLHVSQDECRRLAAICQNNVAADLGDAPVPPSGKWGIFTDQTPTKGVLTIDQSKAAGLQMSTNISIQARSGLGLNLMWAPADKDAPELQAAWDAQWAAWEADPTKVVTWQQTPVVASSQIHLYLETMTSTFYKEDGRYRCLASTQCPGLIQTNVSRMCQTATRDVEVICNRVGGGYGAKCDQSLPVSALATVCGLISDLPVKVNLDRQIDMEFIGRRHEMHGTYRVCVDIATQKILAMDVLNDSDAGCSHAVTPLVVQRACWASDGIYWIPAFRCLALPWFTHKATSTAYRSFGQVQGVTITEMAIEHACHDLNVALTNAGQPNVAVEDFRYNNMYATGSGGAQYPTRPANFDCFAQNWNPTLNTLYQADLMTNATNGLWTVVRNQDFHNDPAFVGKATAQGQVQATGTTSAYQAAQQLVQAFNGMNNVRKLGLALMPLMYGVGYPQMLSSNVALVNIYAVDGSVLVQTPAMEIGQGLHINLMQACIQALACPTQSVKMGRFSTDTTPNDKGTGASVTADITRPAVIAAAQQLRQRLETNNDHLIVEEIKRRMRKPGDNAADDAQAHASPKEQLNTLNRKKWEAIISVAMADGNLRAACKTNSKEWQAITTLFKTDPAFSRMDFKTSTYKYPQSHTDHNYYLANNRSWVIPENGAELPPGVDTLSVWQQTIQNAYDQRVNLVGQGSSMVNPDGGDPIQPGQYTYDYYYTYSAAWSLVEVDGITGEIDVLRSDVYYDAEGSINPGVDVGQIEGAFVQGIGNMLHESVTFNASGRLNERSVFEYLIPDHRTTPRQMNVELFWMSGGKPTRLDHRPSATKADGTQDTLRDEAIARAKGTGEPPLVMSVSALLAARQAIRALQEQFGLVAPTAPFTPLSSPMTVDNTLQAIWGDTNYFNLLPTS